MKRSPLARICSALSHPFSTCLGQCQGASLCHPQQCMLLSWQVSKFGCCEPSEDEGTWNSRSLTALPVASDTRGRSHCLCCLYPPVSQPVLLVVLTPLKWRFLHELATEQHMLVAVGRRSHFLLPVLLVFFSFKKVLFVFFFLQC